VSDIDWRRRLVAVEPAQAGGRSRWLGSARARPAAVCRAVERIVAGAAPGCRLSRRAAAALDAIRTSLPFVDGETVPVVSNADGSVKVWSFAGGAASASLAREFSLQGAAAVGFDDLSISVRGADIADIAAKLAKVDPHLACPRLPDDIPAALKFGLCLPDRLAAQVLAARSADADAVADVCSRPTRLVLDAAGA